MRLSPEPAPTLPDFQSLLVHGPYHPSAPIHLCLSIPPQNHALLFSPSRNSLLQGLQNYNDPWLNAHSGTGTVAATSSRVTIFYPPSPKHLVAILTMLRTHDLSSPPVPVAPKVTFDRAPTLLVLHEPSAYFLPEHEEHTLSSYLLLIAHAFSTIEFLTQSPISSSASLVVFDTRLDHLKLPVIRTPSRSAFNERDDSGDDPRPESVLFFAEKYFELSGRFQCQWDSWIRFVDSWLSPVFQYKDNPSRTRRYLSSHGIVLVLGTRTSLVLLGSICIPLVSFQIAHFDNWSKLAHNMPSEDESGFFSFVLKPGSSLHPSFLLALDGAFAALFAVFAWSAYLTNGNVHFFLLMAIEIALWTSVKWFVQELRMLPVSDEVAQKKDQ